jgi:hypothetical protein
MADFESAWNIRVTQNGKVTEDDLIEMDQIRKKRDVISMSVLATSSVSGIPVQLHNLHITEHNLIFLRIRGNAFSRRKSLIKHDNYTPGATNREMIVS